MRTLCELIDKSFDLFEEEGVEPALLLVGHEHLEQMRGRLILNSRWQRCYRGIVVKVVDVIDCPMLHDRAAARDHYDYALRYTKKSVRYNTVK